MTKYYIPGYPRPQFTRPLWENLNGVWDFSFDDHSRGEAEKWFLHFPAGMTIEVPFSYETPASGVGDASFHPVVWYRRRFEADVQSGHRAILHFEGCDYHTKVWVNGHFAGSHTGGYTRFSFDVTDLLSGDDNWLTVRAEDSDDPAQPRGKQRWTPDSFGCWYVQTTGIWKPVWLEYRPETHLETVKMTPRLADQTLALEWSVRAAAYGPSLCLTAEIFFQDTLVNKVSLPVLSARGQACISVSSIAVCEWGVKTWSPENPSLYDIRFVLTQDGQTMDCVGSYFGMRDIRIDQGHVLLNGKPLYQRLILDQGYWRSSHLTPPDEAAMKEDIDKILRLGFNGARKHQKIEDARFAYWCDVKGLLLWCEMPSAYRFCDEMAAAFTRQWLDVVEQHYNHPSIIVWTPFNESWGISAVKTDPRQQRFTEGIYYLTKALDTMRPVITNDGWEHTISDIITLHDYEQDAAPLVERYGRRIDETLDGRVYHDMVHSAMAQGYTYRGQPILISEFAGTAFAGGAEGEWGYGRAVADEAEFLRRVDELTTAVKSLPHVCGYCYTQVTDVQQEINGIMDIDRNYKADPEAIREINVRSLGNCRVVRQ